MKPILPFVLRAMSIVAPERDHTELGTAIANAVEEAPPLFAGDESRERTASLMVAVAYRESTLRNDIISKTGDACAMQIHARPELAKDVNTCARVGLAMLRDSLRACPSFPIAPYASGPGGCSNARAQRISRDRMALAQRIHSAAVAAIAKESSS